jgi:hypothetical protein
MLLLCVRRARVVKAYYKETFLLILDWSTQRILRTGTTGGEIRSWRVHLRTTTELQDLAAWINPIVRGAAAGDFALVNLFREPAGAPMRLDAVNELVASFRGI